MLLLTLQQVALLLGRKVKALEKDRRDRREALASGLPIDPAHPKALPYVEPAHGEREVRYLAIEVADVLSKRAVSSAKPKQASAKAAGLSGFQGWLAHGAVRGHRVGPARPRVRRLTIFEYSERLASAVAVSK
jgi:hypothetical protein